MKFFNLTSLYILHVSLLILNIYGAGSDDLQNMVTPTKVVKNLFDSVQVNSDHPNRAV